MRVALTLAYNGTHYLGSQIQAHTNNTINGQLQEVLTQLGIDSKIVSSGRTDKGVHATGQVSHIDLPHFWDDTHKLKTTLNAMLPPSIYIKKVQKVTISFHARYSAKKRTYRYILKKGDANPFETDYITFLPDIIFQDLQKNIQLFVGEHDFSFFMKTGSETQSAVRKIYKTFAYQHKGYTILYFQANGFLRSQIRCMVGALLHLNATQIQEMLTLEKEYTNKLAPPNGLYLAKITYN